MYKYISDLHFGSELIMSRCNRPFESVEDMNYSLIQRINKNTDKSDILMILGDVAIYGYDPLKELSEIHCKKVLIAGNHDKSLLSNRSFRKQFIDIRENELLRDGDIKLFLSHYPHAEWDGFYRGRNHFYGHIHNSMEGAAKVMTMYPNAVNVSADVLGFVPKTADDLIKEREKSWHLSDCSGLELFKDLRRSRDMKKNRELN